MQPIFFTSGLLKPIRLIDMLRLSQSFNGKFGKSVLRMVFKSLETFLNRFIFPTFMRCKVKLLEILLSTSHTALILS